MGDGAAPMQVEDEENVQGDPTDEFVTKGTSTGCSGYFTTPEFRNCGSNSGATPDRTGTGKLPVPIPATLEPEPVGPPGPTAGSGNLDSNIWREA